VEWPVTEIVVSSLKKLGKAEKTEGAGPTGAPGFSEDSRMRMCRSRADL